VSPNGNEKGIFCLHDKTAVRPGAEIVLSPFHSAGPESMIRRLSANTRVPIEKVAT